METTERCPVNKIEGGKAVGTYDTLIAEFVLSIQANGTEVTKLVCSPDALDYLVVGFLESAGYITEAAHIVSIRIDGTDAHVSLATPVVRRELPYPPGQADPSFSIRSAQVASLVEALLTASPLFRTTGAAHCSALCTADSLLITRDDISRHNTLDKVFGECLLRGIPVRDKILVTTARLTVELVWKAAIRGVPVMASKAPPSAPAVRLAADAGITLAGFVRHGSMNVYSHPERLLV